MATKTTAPTKKAAPKIAPKAQRGRAAALSNESGVVGTNNVYGVIAQPELVTQLVMPQGIETYRQMRNVAQVQASLWLVKAPILSSTPTVQPPKNGDGRDQEIADWVQSAIFDSGAMQVSWRRVLEHILTRLEFGVSVCEKVWRYDRESGTWRLQKLAPRLANTIIGWHPGTDGNLGTIEQSGAGANGAWVNTHIDASKALISIHQREGDDYWGRSLLRAAYVHWFALMELYRMDLVRADRWSVGIAKAKFTDNNAWMDTKLVGQVKRALKALRSHERAYLLEHPNVEYSVMGQTGQPASLEKSIEMHERGIIQNVLGAFLNGSKGDGLNSSKTRTLVDVFASMIELEADEIAEDLTHQVVRQLCDLNFPMHGRSYPRVKFTNLADDDLEAMTEQLDRLSTAGAITFGPRDEAHFRDLYKLPAADPDEPGRPRQDRTNNPGTPKPRGTQKPGKSSKADPEDDVDDANAQMRAKAGRVTLLGRKPTDLEVRVLRSPEQLARGLDQDATTLVDALADVRRRQTTGMMKRLIEIDGKSSRWMGLKPSQFDIEEPTANLDAIRTMQESVFAFGRREVRQELARQGAQLSLRMTTDQDECAILMPDVDRGVVTEAGVRSWIRLAQTTPKPTQLPLIPDTPKEANRVLISSAQVLAEQLNDLWFGHVLEVGNRLGRGGLIGQALVTAIWEVLEAELTAGLYGKARAEVNETFALARAVEARINIEEIETAVYSCLLDVDSCKPCEHNDGTETTVGSEIYVELMPPFKGCDGNKGGGDACRCMWLFLLKSRTV